MPRLSSTLEVWFCLVWLSDFDDARLRQTENSENSIGAQKKRSLSFDTRSLQIKRSTHNYSAHQHTRTRALAAASGNRAAFFSASSSSFSSTTSFLLTVLAETENETFTSYVYVGGRAENDATPCKPIRSITSQPPGVLDVIVYFLPISGSCALLASATDGCPTTLL